MGGEGGFRQLLRSTGHFVGPLVDLFQPRTACMCQEPAMSTGPIDGTPWPSTCPLIHGARPCTR